MAYSALKSLLLLTFLGTALLIEVSRAAWDISSNVSLNSRSYTQQALWQEQDDSPTQLSLIASGEFRMRGSEQSVSIMPYLRWDETDEERSLVDFREAYWAGQSGDLEVLVGLNTVFWGVTESVHLVDIINQTDAVADIDGEHKLGQAMINLDLQQDWGRLGVFLLPYFRERTFAGIDGRLRTPVPVDTDNAMFESSDKYSHIDLALRYSHYIGNVDIGLSAFKGTSREPILVSDTDGSGLLPFYPQIGQLGIDLQYTGDAWLWKLEAIARDGYTDSYTAAVAGFEYTIYQIGDSSADLGLLLEYQYDGRNENEPVTVADNDLFAGIRLAMNDSQDSNLLAGAGYDNDSGETFVNVEAERRLGDNFVLELRARFFTNISPADATFWLKNDDYFEFSLSRYF